MISGHVTALYIFIRQRFTYRKHLWMISIITSCSSAVILLSDGKQSPLWKISAPTSSKVLEI